MILNNLMEHIRFFISLDLLFESFYYPYSHSLHFIIFSFAALQGVGFVINSWGFIIILLFLRDLFCFRGYFIMNI
jgi:hypothetical protein